MIDLDRFSEAIDTLRANALRTALTALSVAWGIFMLVVLLGAGSGLQHAIEKDFADAALNSIWLHAGRTSIPYQGNNPGRRIIFRDSDYAALRATPGVENPTGRVYRNAAQIRYGKTVAGFNVRAVHPLHRFVERTTVTRGRFINDLDLRQRRKVIVLGTAVVDRLFGHADPLGADVFMSGTAFRVVGVFTDLGPEEELKVVYIPITTAQQIYGRGTQMDQLIFMVGDQTPEESKAFVKRIRADFAERHGFSPEDRSALHAYNNLVNTARVLDLFAWIRKFVWLIGIGTLIAGVVGVSNIMLISVRERTVEIGLRKALGATPRSIVAQVVMEATLLTSVAGYAGLVAGTGLLEIVRRVMPENDYVRSPELNVGAALVAAGLLVVAGVVAGYIPARRAARVQPVTALRNE